MLETTSTPDLGTKRRAECDVVMKGGTTSGIIYPKLIVELSREYRFRQIGGTSAGAIAATMTAAAQAGQLKEPGRAFDGLSSIPEELARDLAHLFRSMMTLMIGRCASGDLWGRTATDAYRAALSKKNGTGELAALTPSQRRELREKRNVDCLVITPASVINARTGFRLIRPSSLV